LNGQRGLFVARLSGLAEELIGWQAFFSVFLKVFLDLALGFGPRMTRIIFDRDSNPI